MIIQLSLSVTLVSKFHTPCVAGTFIVIRPIAVLVVGVVNKSAGAIDNIGVPPLALDERMAVGVIGVGVKAPLINTNIS